MITVFYIQEDSCPRVSQAPTYEPFLNLKDTTLTLVPNGNAPVHFQFPDHLTSSLELASYMNLQVSASGYTGLSGCTASAKNGFLVLETNNTGQLATLDVTEANAPLGYRTPERHGRGTEKSRRCLTWASKLKTSATSKWFRFYSRATSHAGELYFVEFNDGIRKSLQKFTVLRKKNSASVNFVSRDAVREHYGSFPTWTDPHQRRPEHLRSR
jgi:hypothetical protein